MQLTILGYILVPIFDLNAWWLTLLYMLFMLGVAAAEAISRPPAAYNVRLCLYVAPSGAQSDPYIVWCMSASVPVSGGSRR